MASLLLILELLALEPAYSLDPQRSPAQYALRIWGKHEGLPGSWVNAILPTKSGYLWLATPDGLLRFDGARFSVYNHQTSSGLPTDNVLSLCEGRDGRLWVGTSRGLAVGDTRGSIPFTKVEGVPPSYVRSIAEAPDGSVWAVSSQAVYRIDGGRVSRLGRDQGLPGDHYRSLRVDSAGALWLATNQGIAWIEGSKVRQSFSVRDGLTSDDVLSVESDKAGGLWVGTGEGISRRVNGGRFEPVPAAGKRVVVALLQDRDANVWAGTRDGLLRLAGGTPELMDRSTGLADEHITSLAEDADGNLWIGTEAGGVARLRDGRAVVFGTAQSLTHNVIWSVLEGRDGSVWIGTDGGGLNLLRGGRAGLGVADEGFTKENIYAIFEDRSGRIWFSTEWHGLCRLSAGRIDTYMKPFAEDLVRCFYEDPEGGLWVGSSAAVMRIQGDSVVPVPTEDGRKIAVTSLVAGPAGSLWVGTSSGLQRLEGGVVRRVVLDGKAHDGHIMSMHADSDGTLWMATTDSGFQRVRNGHLSSITSRQGLPSDTVLSVAEDSAGRIWLSSTQGMLSVTRSDLEAAMDGRSSRVCAMAITEADGLGDRECSGGVQPSVWRGRDGRLWYPTIAGVAVVDPSRVKMNTRTPQVWIEEVVADGRRLAPGGGLELPAGTRHLEIRYTAPSFSAPERIRFEHKLEGLDPGFFAAGAERVAHYTSLGPGQYRFEVRSSNEDGVWGKESATLVFSVRRYVWQSHWFYGLCVAVLLVASISVFELRVRSLRLREQELKRRVEKEMASVQVLRGLLPICSWCKKVRDDAGYWKQIEDYIRNHSQAEFTHGICPECMDKEASTLQE
jgi:ligand-binding sensor domain-containing protein